MFSKPKLLTALAVSCVTAFPAFSQSVGSVTTFASGGAVGGTAPYAITMDLVDNSIWVSYTNGADRTGAAGSSTVVQYNSSGSPLTTYTIAGYVGGLKFDPASKKIWALQNPGGNSTLTIIDPASGITVASPLSYQTESTTRGYADVWFQGQTVLLSYTNPASPTDPTINTLTSYTTPLQTKAALLMNATGTNLVTGQVNQPTAQSDPGSLKTIPNHGGVMMTSGADGQIIFVKNPSLLNQSVAFLNVLDQSNMPVSSLQDAIFPVGSQGTFYVVDTGNNRILSIPVTNLIPGSLFASVGSLNAFVSINKSGVATALVSTFNKPGRMMFFASQQ